MAFYYDQDAYQKNQLGTRSDIRENDPRSRHNQWKRDRSELQWSWGVKGGVLSPSMGGVEQSLLRKF